MERKGKLVNRKSGEQKRKEKKIKSQCSLRFWVKMYENLNNRQMVKEETLDWIM